MTASLFMAPFLYLLPIESLAVTEVWRLGAVRILDSASARALVESEGPLENRGYSPDFADDLRSFAEDDLEGAAALVEASSVAEATTLVRQSLAVLRVFQQSQTLDRTTMFGLLGEVANATHSYIELGEEIGLGWRREGHHTGFTFPKVSHEKFCDSTGFSMLADLVGAEPANEGQRRALLAVELASQAILEHRPALQLVLTTTAAEALLLDRSTGAQTFKLARRATYILCSRGRHGVCGSGGDTCPAMAIDPDMRNKPKELAEFRRRGNVDNRWRCSEWHGVLDRYDRRSDVVHGGDQSVSSDEAERALFWLVHELIPRVVERFALDGFDPIASLDREIDRLPPPPDWEALLGIPIGVVNKD